MSEPATNEAVWKTTSPRSGRSAAVATEFFEVDTQRMLQSERWEAEVKHQQLDERQGDALAAVYGGVFDAEEQQVDAAPVWDLDQVLLEGELAYVDPRTGVVCRPSSVAEGHLAHYPIPVGTLKAGTISRKTGRRDLFMRLREKAVADGDASLADVFKRHDTDGSGLLRSAELRAMLSDLLPEATAAEKTYFESILDIDGSGEVSWPEFQQAMSEMSATVSEADVVVHMQQLSQQVLQEHLPFSHIFRRVDTSGDGELSFKEVALMIRMLLPKLSAEQVRHLAAYLYSFDMDGSSRMTCDDLARLLQVAHINRTFKRPNWQLRRICAAAATDTEEDARQRPFLLDPRTGIAYRTDPQLDWPVPVGVLEAGVVKLHSPQVQLGAWADLADAQPGSPLRSPRRSTRSPHEHVQGRGSAADLRASAPSLSSALAATRSGGGSPADCRTDAASPLQRLRADDDEVQGIRSAAARRQVRRLKALLERLHQHVKAGMNPLDTLVRIGESKKADGQRPEGRLTYSTDYDAHGSAPVTWTGLKDGVLAPALLAMLPLAASSLRSEGTALVPGIKRSTADIMPSDFRNLLDLVRLYDVVNTFQGQPLAQQGHLSYMQILIALQLVNKIQLPEPPVRFQLWHLHAFRHQGSDLYKDPATSTVYERDGDVLEPWGKEVEHELVAVEVRDLFGDVLRRVVDSERTLRKAFEQALADQASRTAAAVLEEGLRIPELGNLLELLVEEAALMEEGVGPPSRAELALFAAVVVSQASRPADGGAAVALFSDVMRALQLARAAADRLPGLLQEALPQVAGHVKRSAIQVKDAIRRLDRHSTGQLSAMQLLPLLTRLLPDQAANPPGQERRMALLLHLHRFDTAGRGWVSHADIVHALGLVELSIERPFTPPLWRLHQLPAQGPQVLEDRSSGFLYACQGSWPQPILVSRPPVPHILHDLRPLLLDEHRAAVQAAFQAIDSNRLGYIRTRKLGQLLQSLLRALPPPAGGMVQRQAPSEAEEAFLEVLVDVEGKGSCTLQQLLIAVRQQLQSGCEEEQLRCLASKVAHHVKAQNVPLQDAEKQGAARREPQLDPMAAAVVLDEQVGDMFAQRLSDRIMKKDQLLPADTASSQNLVGQLQAAMLSKAKLLRAVEVAAPPGELAHAVAAYRENAQLSLELLRQLDEATLGGWWQLQDSRLGALEQLALDASSRAQDVQQRVRALQGGGQGSATHDERDMWTYRDAVRLLNAQLRVARKDPDAGILNRSGSRPCNRRGPAVGRSAHARSGSHCTTPPLHDTEPLLSNREMRAALHMMASFDFEHRGRLALPRLLAALRLCQLKLIPTPGPSFQSTPSTTPAPVPPAGRSPVSTATSDALRSTPSPPHSTDIRTSGPRTAASWQLTAWDERGQYLLDRCRNMLFSLSPRTGRPEFAGKLGAQVEMMPRSVLRPGTVQSLPGNCRGAGHEDGHAQGGASTAAAGSGLQRKRPPDAAFLFQHLQLRMCSQRQESLGAVLPRLDATESGMLAQSRLPELLSVLLPGAERLERDYFCVMMGCEKQAWIPHSHVQRIFKECAAAEKALNGKPYPPEIDALLEELAEGVQSSPGWAHVFSACDRRSRGLLDLHGVAELLAKLGRGFSWRDIRRILAFLMANRDPDNDTGEWFQDELQKDLRLMAFSIRGLVQPGRPSSPSARPLLPGHEPTPASSEMQAS